MSRHLDHDWFPLGIPENIEVAEDVYVDSSYGFAAFHSRERPGLTLGRACGLYDRTALVVGPRGRVTIGEFSELNATYLICEERIDIGAHCLLAWGVTVTDAWVDHSNLKGRRESLRRAGLDPARAFPSLGEPRPVVIEDNVWVGFDSVILPGVTLGRGCVVGCRSVVRESVPAYAIVVGDPARVVRMLSPTDGEEARAEAMRTRVG